MKLQPLSSGTKLPNQSPLGILKHSFFMAGVFDAISNRKKHLPAHSTLLQLYSHNGPFNNRFWPVCYACPLVLAAAVPRFPSAKPPHIFSTLLQPPIRVPKRTYSKRTQVKLSNRRLGVGAEVFCVTSILPRQVMWYHFGITYLYSRFHIPQLISNCFSFV